MSLVKTISADLDGTPYPILIGKGIVNQIAELLLDKTKNRDVIIVADRYFEESVVAKMVLQLEAKEFRVLTFFMPAGKGNKNIHEVMKIYGIMEENNFARDATLIAIGGGVVGDLAGFVASTWLRGMNLVHVPTSLMSMVDSSVGGKVAINFRRTINAIGNYYHPILNIMDLDFVESLSERDYHSGIAEVIKCGIIADGSLLALLTDKHDLIQQREETVVAEFIARALEIKIDHVKGDVREGGKRLLLNYGHTLGHAVEMSTERNKAELFRHGEGVSIGTMAVAYIAEKYLGLSHSLYLEIESVFLAYNLPTYVDCEKYGFDRSKLLKACCSNVKKDKKRLDNALRLILADRVGKARVYSDVPFELVEEAFEHIVR